LAHRNHYPAIDVLQSVSRLAGDLQGPAEKAAAGALREALALLRSKEDLITIGAYPHGSDPAVDRAIELRPRIDGFLRQGIDEPVPGEQADAELSALFGGALG
jgi:flagellum-specific ATP synthase